MPKLLLIINEYGIPQEVRTQRRTKMESFLAKRALKKLAKKHSFTVIDAGATYISPDAEIGTGSVVYPGVFLHAGTKVGKNCEVYSGVHVFHSTISDGCTIWPDASILDSTIGAGVTIHRDNRVVDSTIGAETVIESHSLIKHSQLETCCTIYSHTVLLHSRIFRECTIGPFAIVEDHSWIGIGCTIGAHAHVRDHSTLCPHVKIAHAEVVRSLIGKGTKAKHLSYIGDASIGEYCNIGAGTVFANYTGSRKRQTRVEHDVFIGSNSTIVGGCTLGAESLIAAGSVIDRNVPPRALVIARGQNHGHVNAPTEPGCIIKENRVIRTRDGWEIKKR